MAYAKFELNNRDAFQQALAVLAAVQMLCAVETRQPGASEIGYEPAGVGGWDDLVEFGQDSQGPYAHHWQVKDQNTNFESQAGVKILSKYFSDARDLISRPDPYFGSPHVSPARIKFHLRFPALNIQFCPPRVARKEAMSFAHLKELCNACRGNAGDAIAKNQGVHLNSGQRRWLEWVVRWLDDQWLEATRVLDRMSVEAIGGIDGLKRNAKDILSLLSSDPDVCLLQIKESIIDTPPEGRLTPDVLRGALAPMSHTRKSRTLALEAHGGRAWSTGHWTHCASDVRAEAMSLVHLAWRRTSPAEVQVCFAPDERAVGQCLCKSSLRLILHATDHRVQVQGKEGWCDAARRGCGGSIGGEQTERMEHGFYVELRPFFRHEPRETYSEFDVALAPMPMN